MAASAQTSKQQNIQQCPRPWPEVLPPPSPVPAHDLAPPALMQRPEPAARMFTSVAVEDAIAAVQQYLGPTKLSIMFERCFPNTLDTTVHFTEINGKPDTFVVTGDIHAMWLRDSSAQVWPYLPMAKEDVRLKRLLQGVIRRQARCINIDPYANAFNFGADGSQWMSDLTAMKPQLHERKWEIDSLCYPVRLAYGYWKRTGDRSVFDNEWHNAAKLIVQTFAEQQRKHLPGSYRFQRRTTTPNDTLNLNGYGNPVRPCGLVASGFRPSDDACIFPFLVPSNLFAIVSLRQLSEIAKNVYQDAALATAADTLRREIAQAAAKNATAIHGSYGRIYAFEVDGYGNRLFMDDANVPSLLSLPYLGCVPRNDAVYQNTRRFVLSDDNPYYFRGKALEGIGGPHTGTGMIWPLSILMRGLTSRDDREIVECLRTLVYTDADTGFMHESIDMNDPKRYTRAWFAWANTLFGELVLKVFNANRSLLAEV